MSGRRMLLTLALALLTLVPASAYAGAVHWNNAAGGNWNVPGNWLGGSLPAATDTAVIDLAGTYTVTVNQALTLAGMRVNGAASGTQTITATSRTTTFANPVTFGGQSIVSFTSCTVNGAGAITNEGNATLTSTSVAQAFANNGTLITNGVSSLNGTLTTGTGSTLRVLSGAASVSLTVANGFTNSAAIELTSSGGAGTASLVVTAGTLTNGSGATISCLAGSGGVRQLLCALNNQGTVTVAANTTLSKASAVDANSGTLDLTSGDLTVTLSGAGTSFTTSGTMNVPLGRTLTLQGNVAGGAGLPYNYGGGTLGGAGTINLTNATLNLNSALATSVANLNPTTSIVNGPSALTISAGTTISPSGTTFNGPVTVEATGTLQIVSSDLLGATTNNGVIECTGLSTMSGNLTTNPGSILRVLSGVASVSLTSANGFSNSATIELTSSGGAGTATLGVTSGTLTNASTGVINCLAGSGGVRQLLCAVANQGNVNVGANTTISKASAVHTNPGTYNLTTGNLTVTLSGAGTSFATNGTINVPASRTLTLQGNVAGGAGLPYNYGGGTLGGAGTINLTNATLNLNSALATSVANLNPTTSIVNGPSALTISAGTTISPSGTTFNGPVTVEATGTLQIVSSDLLGATTNNGVIECTGLSTMSGNLTTNPGSILRVLSGVASVSLTSANGFSNSATIELTSSGGAGTATLGITSGTLTNAVGGAINCLAGSGGVRQLLCAVANQGNVNVGANTTISKASAVHTNPGTYNLTTGNLTVTLSGAGTSFTTSGTMNVPLGRTLTLQGNVAGGAGLPYNYGGGTLGGAGTINLTNATLVLNAALPTSMANLNPTTSIVNGPGLLTISAGTTISPSGTTFNGPVTVEATGLLQIAGSDLLGTTVNNGVIECSGLSTMSGNLTTNPGSILRVLSGVASVSLTSANGFSNSATIELTSSGGAGTATLGVTSGTLTNASTGVINCLAGSGGVRQLLCAVANQGNVNVGANTTISKASAVHTNPGTYNLTTGNLTVTLSGAGTSFATNGTINVPASRTLTLQGNVAGGAGLPYNYGGGTLGGAGTINLTNATLVLNAALPTSMANLNPTTSIVNGPGLLTISAGTTITPSGTTFNGPVTVEATGLLQIAGSDLLGTTVNNGVIECSGLSTMSGNLTTNPGSILRVLSGVASVSLTSATGFSNSATIELTSSGGAGTATLAITSGTLTNASTGAINCLAGSGGIRQLLLPLTNQGALAVSTNTTLSKASAAHTNSGTVSVAMGKVLTAVGASFTNQVGGVLGGSGAITVNSPTAFVQNGNVDPGSSPGILTINSTLPSVASSVYDCEIGGPDPGTGYDQLVVRDAATLSGTLNLSLLGGYQPAPGRRYVIAKFPSRTGTFTNVTGLSYGPGELWAVNYSDTDVVLLARDQTWTRFFPDGAAPAARDGHCAVYDPTSDRMIVFGGRTDAGLQNDVWVLTHASSGNVGAWIPLSPAGGSPQVRTNAAAVYDTATNRLIVYGGEDGGAPATALGDAWVLTNANGLGGTPMWVPLTPSTFPTARSAAGAAYDGATNRLLLFGGSTTPGVCGGASNEVWLLQNANGLGLSAWSQLSPTGGPPSGRQYAGVAWDPGTNRLIVAGGEDGCGTPNMESWLLDHANGIGGTPAWTQLTPAQPAPANWARARFVYDITNQWLDAFGGAINGTAVDTAYSLTQANGVGLGASWFRRLFYGTRPPARTLHSMVIADANQTAIVFGGSGASGRLSDVWRRELDRGRVLAVEPPAPAPTRAPSRTAFAMPPSPSPSRGEVTMAIDVARAQPVDLSVFDVSGRRVATLHNGTLAAGHHSFRWSANVGDRRTAPGVYLVRMAAQDRTEVARFVRLE